MNRKANLLAIRASLRPLAAALLMMGLCPARAQSAGDSLPEWARPYVPYAERVVGSPQRWRSAALRDEQHRLVVALSSPECDICLDRETGIATSLFTSGRHDTSSMPDNIPEQVAVEHAARLMALAGVDVLDGWTLSSVRLRDAGSAGRRYDVGWRRYHCGIRLPSFISVEVNAATGAVTSFLMVDDPVKIPVHFPLSWQAAMARARALKRIGSLTVESAEPAITYDPEPPWPQRAVWKIVCSDHTDGRRYEAVIDAVSGEVSHVYPARSNKKKAPATGATVLSRPAVPKVDWKAARKAKPPQTVFQRHLAKHGRISFSDAADAPAGKP